MNSYPEVFQSWSKWFINGTQTKKQCYKYNLGLDIFTNEGFFSFIFEDTRVIFLIRQIKYFTDRRKKLFLVIFRFLIDSSHQQTSCTDFFDLTKSFIFQYNANLSLFKSRCTLISEGLFLSRIEQWSMFKCSESSNNRPYAFRFFLKNHFYLLRASGPTQHEVSYIQITLWQISLDSLHLLSTHFSLMKCQ